MIMTERAFTFLLLQASLCFVSGQVCLDDGEFRLLSVNATTQVKCTAEQSSELQVCSDGMWYSVCTENWNGRLSMNTCQDLGHSTGYQLPDSSSDIKEQLRIGAFFNCTGREDELSECTIIRTYCPRYSIIHLNCITNEDSCNEGDLRLTGSETDHEGDLEICLFGVWGSVCDEAWTKTNSDVACRQLGFIDGGTTRENNAPERAIDTCTSLVHLHNVTCVGEEEKLEICSHSRMTSTTNYVNNYDCGIFLSCLGTKVTCRDGDLKLFLYVPDDPSAGWLLLCLNNEWGTVCSRNWDFLDSTVACKQLDFIGGFHVEVPLFNNEKDAYDIHVSNVTCIGNEAKLTDCQYSTLHSCFHVKDIFLKCRDKGEGCHNGDLRLADGPTSKSGRLDVCWNDIWGAVCHLAWTRVNTVVACRELGWSTGYEEKILILPEIDMPTLIDGTNCSGSEQRLIDCDFRFNQPFNCYLHQNDVVLQCLATEDLDDCEDGEIKLVGGTDTTQGILNICHQKIWGTVCNHNWDSDIDAIVACRQLGFRESVPNVHTIGGGKGPIHFTNFMCNGSEQSIAECLFELLEIYSTNLCDHSKDVHIACQDPINPINAIDSSSSIVLYSLIPIVLFLIGLLVAIVVIVFCLTCKKRDHSIQLQPSNVGSMRSQQEEPIGGVFYRNTMFADVTSSVSHQNLVPIFEQDHYVMNHTYESIDNSNLRSEYEVEGHWYALLEEGNQRTRSMSKSPSNYDKLSTKIERTTVSAVGRGQGKQADPSQLYSVLELQENAKDKPYNKLKWKKQESPQIAVVSREDYEQIDLSDSEVVKNEKTVNYHKLGN